MTARAASWEDLVVLYGGSRWNGIDMSEKHLARALAASVPVLFVDPMFPMPRRQDVEPPGLRFVAPRIAVLRVQGPPGLTRASVRPLTDALARRAIRRAVGALGARRVRAIVTGVPDVLDACPADHRVVWATDDFVAGADLLGVDADWMARHERRLAARADMVFAVSPPLAERWRRLRPGLTVDLLPNGVDVDAFADVDAAPYPDDVELDGPVAGYVGHLNRRTDVEALLEVADRGRSLLVVGPVSDDVRRGAFGDLVRRPNVCWVGARPSAELPSYLRAMDVGLVPYLPTEFNRASFPLKTLEYLAAGRAAVATSLPAFEWVGSPLIVTASGPVELADATERELDRPRTPELVAARREVAAAHSWRARAETLLTALGVDPIRPELAPARSPR